MDKSIKFTIPQQTEDAIRAFGESHGIAPRTATTVKMILNRVLKVHENWRLKETLEVNGGTTLDFIETAVSDSLRPKR